MPPPAAKRVFIEVSSGISCSSAPRRGSTVAASVGSSSVKQRKESKRISRRERRAMVEGFVDQYRTSNAGRFPTASQAKQQIGGGFYHVRHIIQELEFNHKISLLDKNKDGQMGKQECLLDKNKETQRGKQEVTMVPGLAVKQVPNASEVEEFSEPVVTASSALSKDVDTQHDMLAKGSIATRTGQVADAIEDLGTKEPCVVVSVENMSVNEPISSSRRKIAENLEDSTINGEVSPVTHIRSEILQSTATAGLDNERLQGQGDEADSSVSLKLETTMDIVHSCPLELEDGKEDLKSTKHLDDAKGNKGVADRGDLEAHKMEDLFGDQTKRLEHGETIPKRSAIWQNLKALAGGIINFWKK